jgi:hypothetical protein
MKTRNWMKCMLVTLLLCMGAVPMMAQKNIDKLVEELEKRRDVAINSVTSRDPKTRKITKIVKNFSFKDRLMNGKLIKAFEKDEEYTITAIKDLPKGRNGASSNVSFTFIFVKDNNQKITYTLYTDKSEGTTLTIIMNSKNKDTKDISYFRMDNNFMEGMNESLKDLDVRLKDMKIVIPQWTEKDLEKIFQSAKDKTVVYIPTKE